MLCLDKITIGSYVERNTTYWYLMIIVRSNVSLGINPDEFEITIDECSNIANIDSEDLSMHDYSISINPDNDNWQVLVSGLEIPKLDTRSRSNSQDPDNLEYVSVYQIITDDPTNFLQYLDKNIKYIRINKGIGHNVGAPVSTVDESNSDWQYTKVEGIMYDPNELYHAEIRMLNTFCDTCLDDKQMQLIMLLTFKRQLLEQSIQCMHYKDALQYYLDLCRILNIYVAKKDYGCNRRCNSCIKYWNDTCIKYQDNNCIKLQRPVCNGITCSLCN